MSASKPHSELLQKIEDALTEHELEYGVDRDALAALKSLGIEFAQLKAAYNAERDSAMHLDKVLEDRIYETESELVARIKGLEEQLETAEDHIAGLCDNLLWYGRHTNSCDFRIGGCNCGWETMREALKTPNPAESHD